jgi:CubicO group peptidase (beta-lactamase class C family)
MTIMDILNFKTTYKTTIDMRECTNKEDALKALRTSYTVPEKDGYYLYTDLPIMILTDIMETYSSKSYKELFNKYIVQKYNLTDTYLDINTTERYVTLNKNLVNDPKANIMGGYYGHGGIKATSKDFIKFLNSTLSSKYVDLFVTKSDALDPETNEKIIKKAQIGNLNLSNKEDTSLASKYLPEYGFAIQGSVRCHGETAKYIVDNKEYYVTISIFLDLYTQLDNILKYEQEKEKILTKEYEVDNYGKLIMCDVRSLLSYKGTYKELTNLVGKCRTVELYRYIKEKIRENSSM